MVIIYTGHTEKPNYQFHHSQRDICTCIGHKGNEWFRGTEDCDGEDKREVDVLTKLQVSMSIPTEIPVSLNGDMSSDSIVLVTWCILMKICLIFVFKQS
jgi:hypothetical protein